MFDFYTDAMRFRTALYFLHISKAGGTSFCASAYENACRDPNVRNGSSANSWRWNCWSRPHDDGPKWTMLPFEAAGDKSQPFQFRKFRKDPRNGWCVRCAFVPVFLMCTCCGLKENGCFWTLCSSWHKFTASNSKRKSWKHFKSTHFFLLHTVLPFCELQSCLPFPPPQVGHHRPRLPLPFAGVLRGSATRSARAAHYFPHERKFLARWRQKWSFWSWNNRKRRREK